MSLKLNVRQSGDVSIVDISGRITLGDGAGELREQVRELADTGHTQILLNLGQVSYIDSSGIGLLVGAFATLSRLGGKLELLNLTSRVKDLLVITKLYSVFAVFDDEAVAIASFADVKPAAAHS